MLKMFAPPDKPFDKSEAEVQRFLDAKVTEGKLLFDQGMYSLP